MVIAQIVIVQEGNAPPLGYTFGSRTDIDIGDPVVLSNLNNTGVNSWRWELIDKPSLSTASVSPTLGSSTTFTPELEGSYLVQLTVNGHIKTRVIVAIKTGEDLRLPARGERDELTGGWNSAINNNFQLLEAAIGSGSGSVHALGGASHAADTLFDVNSKISDATLDDSGDPRTPSSHELAGSKHSASTLASLNAKVSDATLDDSGDSRPPSGSAGGQLGDTYPNPTVRGLRETGGPTELTMGAVTDGQVLTRSGSTIVGSAGGGGGGNTLNAAYDQGGAGVGREITVDTGAVLLSASGGPSLELDGYMACNEISTPTESTFRGNLYVKRVSGESEISELHYLDNQGKEIQITDDGYLNVEAGATGGGPVLVFSDDTEFTEAGVALLTKKTFRIVVDSESPVVSWRVIVGMWTTGGSGTAEVKVDIGGDSDTYTSTSSEEEIKKSSITRSVGGTDSFLTVTIKLRMQVANDTAHVKYTDIYAIY